MGYTPSTTYPKHPLAYGPRTGSQIPRFSRSVAGAAAADVERQEPLDLTARLDSRQHLVLAADATEHKAHFDSADKKSDRLARRTHIDFLNNEPDGVPLAGN